MKAVVKYENAANVTELRDVPVPEIGRTDVLVEVAYVGVCGTDPHMHRPKVDLERLVTHELPLDRWEQAFELVETKEANKVVLTPID